MSATDVFRRAMRRYKRRARLIRSGFALWIHFASVNPTEFNEKLLRVRARRYRENINGLFGRREMRIAFLCERAADAITRLRAATQPQRKDSTR